MGHFLKCEIGTVACSIENDGKMAIEFDHFFSLFFRFGWLKDTGRLRHFNSTGSPFSRAKSRTCLKPYRFIGKSLLETKK